MRLWDIKVETKKQKCIKSRKERNKKAEATQADNFSYMKDFSSRRWCLFKNECDETQQKQILFYSTKPFKFTLEGFRLNTIQIRLRWRDDFQLSLPGFVVLFCFDPSTRCRRQQNAFFRRAAAAAAAAAFLTNNRETRNVTEHVHGAFRWRERERESSNRFLTRTHSHAARIPFKMPTDFRVT